MDWNCSECSYINSSEDQICVICEQGYRFFSVDCNQTGSQIIDDDSVAISNDENEVRKRETLSSTYDESERDENDSVINLNDENEGLERETLSSSGDESEQDDDDSLLGASSHRKDIYVREDGQILYGQQATDERKRSIARRKALDLQKVWENQPCKPDPNRQKSSSTFSTHVLKASASGATTTFFTSTATGHFNALTAHAKAANASATAMAEVAAVSTVNGYATGANISASASASGVRVNALNASATGVSTSVNATADGLKVAAGNISVTGVEVAASASASGAKVAVGNVDVNGASVGASVNVNGAGVSAFNVAVGGPSAAASVNVDGSLSFGNVNLGLRPSLDIGVGLNIGIPFLSGSRNGSDGGGNNKDSNSNGDETNSKELRGLEGCQKRLSEKFPNQRHYAKAAEFSIERNTANTPIDPTLTDKRLERDSGDNPVVDSVVEQHKALLEERNKFVGFKGGPKRSNIADGQSSSQPTAPSTDTSSSSTSVKPSSNDEWNGMYTSPSPDVAGGYAMDEQGRPGVISRVYIREDAADSYYTATGLNTREGTAALREVKSHSNGRYIFSGPQHATDPDLRAPETVISPAVRDEALAAKTIKFEPSAHGINPKSYRMETVYERELECSSMVPDFNVNMIKGPADCERDGGRERLGHVFQGRPPYGYETVPPKKKELNKDDQLLLEECRKLGFEVPLDSLDEWKKKLKSDEEYERDEDNRSRQAQSNTNSEASGTEHDKKEPEEEKEPPKPCKDHPINVRCMKCMNGSSGPKIRHLHGRVHGFKFNN